MENQLSKDELSRINVLVVSEGNDEVCALRGSGFVRIDHIRSSICAVWDFRHNKRKLREYDFIVLGQTATSCYDLDEKNNFKTLLEKAIRGREKPYIVVERTNLGKRKESKITIVESFRNSEVHMHNDDFDEILIKCVDCLCVVKDRMRLDKRRDFAYKPLVVNRPKKSVPGKREDIKVLLCYPHLSRTTVALLDDTFKLNITYFDTARYWFDKVFGKLGDYDLIVSADDTLAKFVVESREQCMRSGRQVAMLVVCDELKKTYVCGQDTELSLYCGDVKLRCFKSGAKYAYYEIEAERAQFKIPFVYNYDESLDEWYEKKTYTAAKALIDVGLNAYVKYLSSVVNRDRENQIYWTLVGDKTRSPLVYDRFYKRERMRVERSVEKEYEPVDQITEIKEYAGKYLDYRKNGIVFTDLDKLRITEMADSYRIELVNHGVVQCSIVIQEVASGTTLWHTLEIKDLDSKRRLGKAREVVIGIKRYAANFGEDMMPTRRDLEIVQEIYDQVEKEIVPIVDVAFSPISNGNKRISLGPVSRNGR